MGIFSPDTITDFVRRGDVEGVRRRLEQGDDVNERRSFKGTPLIEAARKNDVAIIKLLLHYGADMELVNSNELTALHTAIDDKKTAAAIFLAQRGACANKTGFMGRTPLQSAIKRNLLDVTTELLANGADPMVFSESHKVAKAFVRSGPDREKFLELLDAYANDKADASFRKPTLRDVAADLSTIYGAIQAKHEEAVSTILRASLEEDVLEDMLSKRQSIELAIKDTSDEMWRFTLTQIGDEFDKNLLTQVMKSNSVKRLQELVDGVDKPDWIHKVRLNAGWTALHVAASLDSLALVRYLLVDCGMNPLSVSSSDKLALDIALDGGGSNEMCWMLLQHMKKRAFSDRSTLLLGSEEMTLEGLRQLLGHMTSVYDLRLILSLGFKAFSPSEMHAVLIEAFEEVIREKLVFDDHAAVFFKVGLQECRRQELISEAELIEWDLKTTKVNVENSEWVREIKHSLQEVEFRVAGAERNIGLLHSHFNALRDALIQNQEYETKRRTRDRLISLVSSALVMCGGLVIKDVFGAIFDMWDPAKLLGTLTNMSSSKMADFLAEKTSTIIFKDGVEAVLVDSDVDPVEFAVVLRDAVKLEQADASIAEPIMLAASDTKPSGSLLPSKKTILRFKAVVLAAVFMAKIKTGKRDRPELERDQASVASTSEQSSQSTILTPGDVSMSEADLESYPFHYAVKYSEGNLEQFQELVQYIEDGDGDVNETLSLYVRPVSSSASSEKWQVIQATALVYASYLGYVDIVKWILAQPDVVPTEKKFLTVKRARSNTKISMEVRLRSTNANMINHEK